MILPVAAEDAVAQRKETTLAFIILNAGLFLLLPRVLYVLMAYHSQAPLWHQAVASVTSQFLHKDLSHLAGNMWFLWLFGPAVDGAFRRRYVPFYIAGGVVANVSMYFESASRYSLVGASGAIAAVIAAYCTMYPHSKIKCFTWFAASRGVIHVPAAAFGFLFFGWDYLMMTVSGGQSVVAYAAHLGGALFGVIAGFAVGPAPAVPAEDGAPAGPSVEEAAAARESLAMRLGESLAIEVPAESSALAPAGVFARAGALCIDFLLLIVILVAIAMVAGRTPGPPAARNAFAWGVWLIYLAASTAAWGATPGKLAAGLRVVTEDTGPVRWPRALARAAASLLSFPLVLGVLPACFGGHKRALHDRLAGTRVIYAPGVGSVRVALVAAAGLAIPVLLALLLLASPRRRLPLRPPPPPPSSTQ
ncbi:MAG: rhomboid family intramembrane serine protease [Elusimicrobia bacterium]|nr:rhomboid family intramembrane serine protease [Elusimicrobiota bacterium]